MKHVQCSVAGGNRERSIAKMIMTIVAVLCLGGTVFAADSLTAVQSAVVTGAGNVAITCDIEYTGTVLAVGVRSNLPAGASFTGAVEGDVPALKPPAGTKGVLEFAWIDIPEEGLHFTYELEGVTDEGVKSVVLYRRMGGELSAVVEPDPVLP